MFYSSWFWFQFRFEFVLFVEKIFGLVLLFESPNLAGGLGDFCLSCRVGVGRPLRLHSMTSHPTLTSTSPKITDSHSLRSREIVKGEDTNVQVHPSFPSRIVPDQGPSRPGTVRPSSLP